MSRARDADPAEYPLETTSDHDRPRGDEFTDELDRAIASVLGGDRSGYVRVYRYEVHGSEETWAYCRRVPAGDFDPETFAQGFGGGRYKFVFVDGANRIRTTMQRTIASPLEPEPAPSRSIAPQPVTVDPSSAGSGSSFMEKLLIAMITGQQQMTTALIGAMGKGNGGGINAGDIIAAVKEGRQASDSNTVPEMIRLGIDLARGREDDSGGDMFSRFAPKALDILDTILKRPAAGGAQPGPVQGPGGGVPAADVLEHPIVKIARGYAPRLLEEAQKDRDPVAWGIFVGERVPDAWAPALLGLVSAEPDALMNLLGGINAELMAHRAWILEAAGAIRSVLEPEPEEADAGATGATNQDPAGGAGHLDNGPGDPADDPPGGGASGGPGGRGPSIPAARTL